MRVKDPFSIFELPRKQRFFQSAGRGCFVGLLLLGTLGCSPWLRKPSEVSLLPPAPVTPETVTLEIAFVHVGVEESAREMAIWKELDEQFLSLEERRRFQQNGFRVARIGGDLPTDLRKLLDQTLNDADQAPTSESVSGEDAPALRSRQLQLNTGKRGKIVVSPTLSALSVLTRDDHQRVTGQQFSQAQCLFSIRAFPEGDSSARVELTPEIEHGEVKNRWIPVEGALVQQIGKERHAFEQLRLDVRLAPGQTCVIGGTLEAMGVARPFFSVDQPRKRRVMLLVRLAQSQLDDLFAPQPKRLEVSTNRD